MSGVASFTSADDLYRYVALLKLVPSTKQLFPAYVELLRADGRDDLLADD